VRLLRRLRGAAGRGAERGVGGEPRAQLRGALAQPRRHHAGEARRGARRVAGERDARAHGVRRQLAEHRGERLLGLLADGAGRARVGVALGGGQPRAQPERAGALARVHAGALRVEPGELHLEVAPGVGAARRLAQPARLALPHAPRELGLVGGERAPEAPHGDAEVVQRLRVVGLGEAPAGRLGAGGEGERDEPRPLLGGAGEQVAGEPR
jgi:hypothetical protein